MTNSGKLILVWCGLMLSVPVALALLGNDLVPGQVASATWKLALVFGAVAAIGLALTYAVSRRWTARAQILEEFVEALPNAKSALPDGGPEELRNLARSMRAMSSRLNQVVERGNLELSRRETILACMAEGVLSVDRDLRVNFCNDAFAQAFGTRSTGAEGRSLYEVVREEALREILERVVISGEAERDLIRLPSAAGRWFEARALPLGLEPKRGAVIALHDVTDIQHQEQMRKDFVADVSHELRTPLAAIRGYAETLLDGALEDEQNNRKFVEVIFSHAVRLNDIASDLLVISELDNNTTSQAPNERVSIAEVVQSAFNTAHKTAAGLRVRLKHSIAPDCFVAGLRFRLEQVMTNLIDNAVKFNRPDGEVMVECTPTGANHYRITVADTGIGIPSEELKRIFERFYRVDKSRARPTGGTGLGLPIVREVVERMGGTVSVESQFGRGTKFTLVLRAG